MTTNVELMTEKEAAEFLRLSTLTLYRLRKSGELPYVRLASKLFYKRSDLIDLIERQTRNPEVAK